MSKAPESRSGPAKPIRMVRIGHGRDLMTSSDPQGQQLSEDIRALERGCSKTRAGSRNEGRLAVAA
jgi:hypothetical protein